jgi:hypothetical protein
MKYTAELKPRAEKDLKALPTEDARRVVERLRMLENDLAGDVKNLQILRRNTACGLGTGVCSSRLKKTASLFTVFCIEKNLTDRRVP